MTQDFNGFGLPAKLLQSLARLQFTMPTPIQAEAIPLALLGNDILGSAQTGTGKTGAFGIPLIARLMDNPAASALVMTPTRELATQVAASLQQMIPVPDLKIAVLIGGESMFKQLRELDHHPRIIVGTPGRINDHLIRKSLKLDRARFLVLDETDRMLDMGFGPQLDKIMEYMPKERQTMMFSATMPENIVKLSRKYLKDAKRIAVGSTTSPITKIKQEAIRVSDGDKYKMLLAELTTRTGSIIIFVKTKYGTEKLSDKLNKDAHRSDAIHGDLQQRRRDRVIQGFRDKRFRILVATDVAARGLDIPHIEHVINYDLPQAPEDYIHRIGRTARAGAEGAAVNFITPSDNIKWNAIHKLMHGVNDPENRGGGGGGYQGRKPFGKRPGGFSGPPKKWSKPANEGGEGRSEGRSQARAENRGGHESRQPVRLDHATGERAEGRKFTPRDHSVKTSEKSHHKSSPVEGRSDKHRSERPQGEHRAERPRTERARPEGGRSDGHRSEGHRPERAPGEHRSERPRSNHARPEGRRSDGPRSDTRRLVGHSRSEAAPTEGHRSETRPERKTFEGRKSDNRKHVHQGSGHSRPVHASGEGSGNRAGGHKPPNRASRGPSTRAAS